MKIAVVGCGAVGSYYGARLGRSGQEMHFLLRSDYGAVRSQGVFIQSPEGDFRHQPRCARSPEEIGVSDLVLIGLKTTANDQLGRLLTPLVGPSTVILTLQNGLGNEELLAELFGAEKIMGGLCFVCLNRIAPGMVRHIAHGTVVMGEHLRRPEPRTHEIAAMFRNTGVPCNVAENLEGAHWEKLVWNIPFNGLGVAGSAGYDAVVKGEWPADGTPGPCVPTDRLLGDPRWEQLVRELMLEVITAGNARGHQLTVAAADRHLERTRRMGAYSASTLLDFENGQPLEMETLFLEPLRQARQAGVATPRLTALCKVLRTLDAGMANRRPGGRQNATTLKSAK
jgi:2-dehydropantoate 2-reductase